MKASNCAARACVAITSSTLQTVLSVTPRSLPDTDALSRLQRIRREDALEAMERRAVLQAYSAGETIFISKRHGLWDWQRDGIPGWLLPELDDAGLLPEALKTA